MCQLLVLGQAGLECIANFVNLTNFRECAKEIVSRDWWLALEVWKPERLSILSLQSFHNFWSNVVVDDIFEINQIKIVSPRMQHTETLMLYALGSVLFNVFFDELVWCFIGWNWICKIIGIDLFLRITDERSDRFDAWWWLQILVLNLSIK